MNVNTSIHALNRANVLGHGTHLGMHVPRVGRALLVGAFVPVVSFVAIDGLLVRRAQLQFLNGGGVDAVFHAATWFDNRNVEGGKVRTLESEKVRKLDSEESEKGRKVER